MGDPITDLLDKKDAEIKTLRQKLEQLRTQQGGEAVGEVYVRSRYALLNKEMPAGTKLYTHPPAPVPEGYVMVPVEPTGDMIDAYDMSNNGCIGNSLCPDGYRAMLKAAQGGE